MTLDGPKGNQDPKASENPEETSEKDPETLTREQEKQKAVSDALSAAGRDAKAMEAREGKVKDALAKAEKLQADIKKAEGERAEREYRADLERAGDDPLARSKVELSQTIRKLKGELGDTKTELGKRDEELTDARKVVAESTKERNAREIASKYEVNLETLKLTDGSVEAMEALAKQLTGKEIKTLKVDSSKTTTGSGPLTVEQVRNMSPEERAERSKEIAKLPLGLK